MPGSGADRAQCRAKADERLGAHRRADDPAREVTQEPGSRVDKLESRRGGHNGEGGHF